VIVVSAALESSTGGRKEMERRGIRKRAEHTPAQKIGLCIRKAILKLRILNDLEFLILNIYFIISILEKQELFG
jgi:hypothetical protein